MAYRPNLEIQQPNCCHSSAKVVESKLCVTTKDWSNYELAMKLNSSTDKS